ncbi:uncharacterized protein F5891DRAFT_561524 [Suillus fuscotomentosus]|uniref:DUF6535 domain-containing protein n=1 Tax=Suillus fuscotomentosus TaxID=1912939 RepID=A0AAD4DZG6_9AGAM|nr:uncharacterized protein F5891DRAFT_561524 [Suillus fuscotomentosus]KAG1896950.1 hypothetical protein F5891DRAFT_561524 [Suillus fuscotomentosus]
MASASSRPSPIPVATDLLTNENTIEADLVTNMASTLEQIRDELRPNNVNEDRGSLVEDMSYTMKTLNNGAGPNSATENPAVFIEGSLAMNMSDTLGQILEVLRESTIAGEHGKDAKSKFWAKYKKISNEYDDDFLNRAHNDITVILTFAGLLSTVIATFVIGMQPDPTDTTNALLVQLIEITINGSSASRDISNLSSSTGYSSSTVWIQTLAYMSLALSVIAAFGGVLGKQCLNSYEAAREKGGTSEESGMRRQMKLDGLVRFQLRPLLQVFLVLLQIALVLFSISLCLKTWADSVPTFGFMATSATLIALSYAGTILVSVWWPNSPFQTPGTDMIRALCKKILPKRHLYPSTFAISSAIRWILETSTDPSIVEAAAAMVPSVPWSPNLDASAAFVRLRESFVACRDRDELYVKYGKAMAHLCIQSVKIKKKHLLFRWDDNKFKSTRSRFIRDAFIAGQGAYYQSKNSLLPNDILKYRADTRTALRTMLVHGQSLGLSRPDDEELIWSGDLCWYHGDGDENSYEEFDWLVDYLASDTNTDDETEGDALLALSAMQGLGSSTKQQSYISSLIRCLHSTTSPRVRHAALRAVFEAREALAFITDASMPQGVDGQLLDELSKALLAAVRLGADAQLLTAILTAVRPKDDQTTYDTGPDGSSHENRDYCYIRLIYALTKNDEWCRRLTRDGHLERCISLVDGVSQKGHTDVGFCLLVIFGRIASLGKDFPFSPAEERWRLLLKNPWNSAKYLVGEDGYVDEIPAFVTATRLNLTVSDDCVPKEWFKGLAADVRMTLVDLRDSERQAILADDGVAQATMDAALSSMQGLYDDLCRMTEDQKAL